MYGNHLYGSAPSGANPYKEIVSLIFHPWRTPNKIRSSRTNAAFGVICMKHIVPVNAVRNVLTSRRFSIFPILHSSQRVSCTPRLRSQTSVIPRCAWPMPLCSCAELQERVLLDPCFLLMKMKEMMGDSQGYGASPDAGFKASLHGFLPKSASPLST